MLEARKPAQSAIQFSPRSGKQWEKLPPACRPGGLGDFLRDFGKIIAILILLLLLSGLESCRKDHQAQKANVPSPRIVSLAPNLTEIVFALGMGDHLVGVTDHCNYPPEAKTRPRLGGLKNISLESVVAQEPDVVLATEDGNEPGFLDQLTELGLKVKTYQPGNLDQVLETIIAVGEELGKKEQAEILARELKEKQADAQAGLAGAEPVPIFLFFQREPLISAGPGTFANDLIQKAGGINLAGDARIPYPHYSLEKVIEKAPKVIIDVSMGEVGNAQEEANQYWSKWPDLPAVRDQRIYVLDQDLITRPGPRLFQGLLELAKILHPERFQ